MCPATERTKAKILKRRVVVVKNRVVINVTVVVHKPVTIEVALYVIKSGVTATAAAIEFGGVNVRPLAVFVVGFSAYGTSREKGTQKIEAFPIPFITAVAHRRTHRN